MTVCTNHSIIILRANQSKKGSLLQNRAVYDATKLLRYRWRLGAKWVLHSFNVIATVTNFLNASYTSDLDASSTSFRTSWKVWDVPPWIKERKIRAWRCHNTKIKPSIHDIFIDLYLWKKKSLKKPTHGLLRNTGCLILKRVILNGSEG